MEASTSGNNNQGQEDVDWSSVDQVANLVSKTTLAGLQQLWRQHATTMDEAGRSFAQQMYTTHSQAVKDIASVKDFNLQRVLELLNSFTGATREAVLELLQDVRKQDDEFTSQLYQTSRSAFSRNLRAALDARDAWYREKLRGLRSRHEAQLVAVRHSAQVELQQRQMQLKVALARTLARSTRAADQHTHAAVMNALSITGDPAHGSVADGGSIVSASVAASAFAAGGGEPFGGGACGPSAAPSLARGGGLAASVAAAAAAAVTGEAVGHAPGPPGTANTAASMSLAPEAAMLEELFEDASAADALARELEVGLAKANAEILELRAKIEGSQVSLQEAQAEAGQWRSKWAIESTKTDSVKREAMAIISKCEEHVTQLQQQHIAELSQRDYLLQRCRDAIAVLEAKSAAAAAPP